MTPEQTMLAQQVRLAVLRAREAGDQDLLDSMWAGLKDWTGNDAEAKRIGDELGLGPRPQRSKLPVSSRHHPGPKKAVATRDADGWQERSREYPDGQVVRWKERPIQGQRGAVTRVYSEPRDEYAATTGTAGIRLGAWEIASPAVAEEPAGETSAPARARRRPVSSPPVRRVAMTWAAHGRLLAFDLTTGVERCGGLWGDRDGDCVTIRDVSLSEQAEYATPSSARFDSSHIAVVDERHRDRTGLGLAGTWHVHPGLGSSSKPSDTDLRSWVSWLDEAPSDVACHVGLILTPNWQPSVGALDLASLRAKRWRQPSMHAYAIRLNEGGRPVGDSLRVELEPTPVRPWVPALGKPEPVPA